MEKLEPEAVSCPVFPAHLRAVAVTIPVVYGWSAPFLMPPSSPT